MNLGDLSIGFALLSSFLGGMAILCLYHRWRDRRDAGLFQVAGRLRGTVSPSEGLGPRSVTFLIEGRHASIEFEERETPQTRVRVSMSRRSPGVFRILRPSGAMGLLGTRDIKVGNVKFDRHWYITARPETLVRRIFTEDRIDQVMRSVERLAPFTSPAIEITRDVLVVRVEGHQHREADLDALVQTASEFVGYLLRLGPEEGIAWVAEGEAGLCPVCAASMDEGVVHCDRCKTPHHEECWTYVGQCSTYACKGKRCVA